MLTREHARLIVEARDIEVTLNDQEERGLLAIHNQELLDAYLALQAWAVGVDGAAPA